MPPQGGRNKGPGQAGGKKKKRKSLNTTTFEFEFEDKAKDDKRETQREESGERFHDLDSTSLWGSKKNKKNRVAETVEDKVEPTPPQQRPEGPVAAEQDQGGHYSDQRGFDYETEQPSEYQQYGVTQAQQQGYEQYYGQIEGVATETERYGAAEVVPQHYEVLGSSDQIKGLPTEMPQQEVDYEVDPFDDGRTVIPPREEIEEELPDELPVDFEGGLSENCQQLSIQTEDDEKEEGTSTTDSTIASGPTDADSNDTPPTLTQRPVILCDSCDKSIGDVHLHCDTCRDGESYDLCLACADSGIRCTGEARSLHKMVHRLVSKMPSVPVPSGAREPRPYGPGRPNRTQTTQPQPQQTKAPVTARTPRPYAQTQPKPNADDPIIKMIVDNNTSNFVANRKQLLSSNTDYFAKNAIVAMHSTARREYGLFVNFKGDRASIDVIKQYSQWLHNGVLRIMADPVTAVNATDRLNFLVSAHIFGEVIRDRRWLNDVMDAFIIVHSESRETIAPPELVHHVYKHSHPKSPMRRLFADMEAYNHTEEEDVKAKFEGLPSEFALDVLSALVSVRPVKQTDWWTYLGENADAYHAYAKGQFLG